MSFTIDLATDSPQANLPTRPTFPSVSAIYRQGYYSHAYTMLRIMRFGAAEFYV